jgi:MFS transporter, ACS family, hexuronate transporter
LGPDHHEEVLARSGAILGGLVSGFVLRRGFSVTIARKTSVAFFAVPMTSAIPAVIVRDARTSICLLSLATLGYTGSLANMLAMPSDVFPKNAAASVYGLASTGSGFGRMLFTLMTGWAVDHYSYSPVFFGFGITPLICALIPWTILGPLRMTAQMAEVSPS